jgi:hypothetical protein
MIQRLGRRGRGWKGRRDGKGFVAGKFISKVSDYEYK